MNSDPDTKSSLSLANHHWGTALVEQADNKISAIHSHPDDPNSSCLNQNLDSLSSDARIRRPAVRKGFLEHGHNDTGRSRGAEPFIQVSWEEALELVAGELNRIKDTHGNQAIYAGSYGWASAGRFHHAQSQLKRFLNCFGGAVYSEGNYSYNAALVLMPHIVGNFRDHIKQATRWSVVREHGELVVMFGGMAQRNTQISGGGIGRHTVRDELIACRKAGVKFINISPLRSDGDEALEAQWIAPRPGSDTAIMMGIAHTLLVENRHDKAFLKHYTTGFERVSAYLTGASDGIVKDAIWAAEASGISANTIRDLAKQMSGKRTLITTAAGLQRAEFGEQPLWMTVTLASMLGQIGLPGGGYGIAYGADASIGIINRPVRWPSFPQGRNAVTDFIPVACIADMLLNPGAGYDYNGQKRSYPDIKMVWWAGGNPFHHHQDLNRLRQAFRQPETIIVNEINWTSTARHADIVLPVTCALERQDIGAGSQDNAIIPMPKVLDPVGESRDEFKIYCELEKKLDMDRCFSENKTAVNWLEDMWAGFQAQANTIEHPLPSFDEFMAGDPLYLDDPAPDQVFLADFRKDPEIARLPTPSGKIELFSQVIDSFNYPDCPGHATWIPPSEWLGDTTDNPYPLHLISGQPKTRLHSQLDNGEYSMMHKIQGREPVFIHPLDAEQRGINDGDIVVLFNDRGECLAGASITDKIRENVVFLWTGAWYDPDLSHPRHRDRHGNPNVLTHDKRTSSLSQSPASHSTLVDVKKFIGQVPAVGVFRPPDFESRDHNTDT